MFIASRRLASRSIASAIGPQEDELLPPDQAPSTVREQTSRLGPHTGSVAIAAGYPNIHSLPRANGSEGLSAKCLTLLSAAVRLV